MGSNRGKKARDRAPRSVVPAGASLPPSCVHVASGSHRKQGLSGPSPPLPAPSRERGVLRPHHAWELGHTPSARGQGAMAAAQRRCTRRLCSHTRPIGPSNVTYETPVHRGNEDKRQGGSRRSLNQAGVPLSVGPTCLPARSHREASPAAKPWKIPTTSCLTRKQLSKWFARRDYSASYEQTRAF